MMKIFSKVIFVLAVLGFPVIAVHDAEGKKIKLSKRYIPSENPGGAQFHEDEDFAESYQLYEQRRDLIKKKKLQSKAISKKELAKKLEEKRIIPKKNELRDSYNNGCTIKDDASLDTAMINKHGINIARFKGAKFIDDDPVQNSDYFLSDSNADSQSPSKRNIDPREILTGISIDDKKGEKQPELIQKPSIEITQDGSSSEKKDKKQEDGESSTIKQEENDFDLMHKTEVSPISITIKNNSSERMICSDDDTEDLDNCGNTHSGSFGSLSSVVDKMK